ncbi:uncharacterized protein LOC111106878 [Crassostrea virginica]
MFQIKCELLTYPRGGRFESECKTTTNLRRKRALEKDVSSLKGDVLNIQKKTSDLEEEVAALQDLSCKRPEDALNTKVLSNMPFAIPIAQTEEPNQIPAFETTNNEFVTAVVVEYTNNRPGRR